MWIESVAASDLQSSVGKKDLLSCFIEFSSCTILSFTAVNLTVHFLLLRDWLTRLPAGFWLAGRIRVLSAVPPPSDDGHPLPTPDGKLPEQRGAEGTAVTRKSNRLLLHYFLRRVICYFSDIEMFPLLVPEWTRSIKNIYMFPDDCFIAQFSVNVQCLLSVFVWHVSYVCLPAYMWWQLSYMWIRSFPLNSRCGGNVFRALRRLSSCCQELFLPSFVSAVFFY